MREREREERGGEREKKRERKGGIGREWGEIEKRERGGEERERPLREVR